MEFLFPPPEPVSAAIAGDARRFPVRRIYCVGRNYAAHTREMGKDPERDPPFFFIKPADALMPDGADVPYPAKTSNLHHEIELVLAIGVGGRDIALADAPEHVFGYAVGNDLTRRDLQLLARDAGRPWSVGKGFQHSAPMGAIHPVSAVGHIEAGRIWLDVNGELRQDSDVRDMIWSPFEIVADLSAFFTLHPGDLIFTGTPAGVGPVARGDVIRGGVDRLGTLTTTIV